MIRAATGRRFIRILRPSGVEPLLADTHQAEHPLGGPVRGNPMNDVPKIALAAGVLGGYVLGRTKKARVAFAAATYLAGRRFGLEPQQLLAEGIKRQARR
ncbi:hypothetical protein Scel_11190 [Streptomyces cellostaticus]|nr:hypothetical protein Scel_11190 [Streptomyces cellostaticus]